MSKKVLHTLSFMLLFFGLNLMVKANSVYAMPGGPGQINVQQPDGSQFNAVVWGDEKASGLETAEGYSIDMQSDGWWVYTLPEQAANKASLQSLNGLKVGHDAPPAVETQLSRKFFIENPQAIQSEIAMDAPALMSSTEGQSLSSASISAVKSSVGTQPVLVILGFYENMPPKTNPADFQAKFFGNSKSVSDYYRQASYGKLNLVPATETFGNANDGIVGWVNLGKTHPSPSNTNYKAAREMVAQAVYAADNFVNFAAYDKDGNGYLSSSELHVVVIVAGYEASYDGGVAKPTTWGHQWTLSSPANVDNVYFGSYSYGGSYTMFGEMMGRNTSTIGIMIHELGHEFGFPDLYSYVPGAGAGVGAWDIMAYGGWSMAPGDTLLGQTPPMPNAYLRMSLGWIDGNDAAQLVKALDFKGQPINMTSSSTAPFALIAPADPNPSPYIGEFFMAENRQRVGYDASLPGSGALVWHIDESVYNNNDPLRPRVRLVQADGADHLRTAANFGDDGDAFSANSINTRFGVGSALSSNFYSGIASEISFDFAAGGVHGMASPTGTNSIVVVANLGAVATPVTSPMPYSLFLPVTMR